jgi:L-asparagine oxygenase
MTLLENKLDTTLTNNSANINHDMYCLNKSKEWSNELEDYFSDICKKNSLAELKKFKENKESVLFIRNMPIGNIPNTPTRKGYIKNEYIITPVKFLFSLFSILKVSPVSYIGENYGKTIRHVVPRISANKQVSSHGFVEFNYHVDNPDLSLSGEDIQISTCPEYLVLFCLRGSKSATTEIVELKDIIKKLSKNELKDSQKPIFDIKRPDSFEEKDNIVKNIPLIYKNNNKYLSRYDYHNISSTQDEGVKLLDKFKSILDTKNISRKIIFKAGDVLIFKNQETLHKRSFFIPNYNGNDRWLLRVFGMNNIYKDTLYNQIILKS